MQKTEIKRFPVNGHIHHYIGLFKPYFSENDFCYLH